MTTISKTSAQRLTALADRARAELNMLSFATKPWVMPKIEDGAKMLDVVIIGAGQSGLVVGHALKRHGVTNFVVLDRNRQGYEGVWETYARNHEIRSPKEIMGADLGLPSMTIESFYRAKHGDAAWDEIKRIPRTDWMDFLRWYRAIADLPIRNEVTVADIDYDANGVTITTKDGETLRTRLVILATGMDGGGGWQTPEIITRNLPHGRYNHACEVYDVSRFKDKSIGVLGAGAAAFDAAVAALDAGARHVDLFMRRPQLPMIDVAREIETAGQLNHGHELSDETKWGLSRFMSGLSQSPAEHHFYKACSFDNFAMHLGSPWWSVGIEGDMVAIKTPKSQFRFDHVVSATGVAVDMTRRPELGKIAKGAALWRDRFTPPADDPAPGRLNFPYLNHCYQFTEREPGTARGIERIFAFNALASLSMGGMSAVSISSHRFGVPRVVAGVTGFLFREQEQAIIPMLAAYNTPGIVLTDRTREKLGLAVDSALAKAG
ncbi:NAD(P)-binding domain-containing protein [Pelagibacterium halotolerans]|uniref:Oxidoreductase n=1 Tax=Pelagibacterium halotolerans (strain DSM 22347 / JCM 15775 / CGMCC 1.7692 / B2) TaxID=1082931 RepID=G4REQ0_PELHB|nr:NAD(P)/FAD-dependent oxidoreductase [Pelagibacterium halotolerans]AEQ50900.1 oxidoreductase [Pelagibacterium halotolerans B2]QJR19196.1 NAD(P)/FAD-dependent oxidoreductase [Pelagibacterium halotolerans]SDZ99394.1 Predicted flavoprotein CzcO associated with the cation diffusion facilitator CzcD [Pelagibacterium halotolerans]